MSDSLDKEGSLIPNSDATINDSLGHSLFCRYWEFNGSPRAIVFICHGFAEHSGRYNKVASAMTKNGIMVFGHDHVGHGLSDGDRVHVDDFMTYVNGVILHVQKMKEKYPKTPIFIYGHSMGGQITVLSLLGRPDLFRGAILVAPLILLAPELLNPVRIFFGRMISHVCPQAPVIKLDPNHICSDPAVVEEILNDPLCYHGYAKARQAAATLDIVQETDERLEEVTTPFLVLHGTDDHLTYLPGSQELYDRARSTDKKILIYEGASHALHDEPGIKHKVIQESIDWILERCD